MLPAQRQLSMADAKLAYFSTRLCIFERSRSITPSTMLEKKDSSSRRSPAGEEGSVESWAVEGSWRFVLKSSLSMLPGLELRLELQDGMVCVHCHLDRR